jgi:hypothetical protein
MHLLGKKVSLAIEVYQTKSSAGIKESCHFDSFRTIAPPSDPRRIYPTPTPGPARENKMARSFNLIVVLVVALSAVQATVIREGDVARLLPEGRANTIITVVTTTATGPTTVVKS